MVPVNQPQGLLLPRHCYLLNQLLDFGNLLLLGRLRVHELLVWISQLVLQVLLEIWVSLNHSKLDDVVHDVLAVHEAKELLRFYADRLQLGDDLLRGRSLRFAFFIAGEDHRLEEEPDSVREEHVRLCCVQDQVGQVSRVFKSTFQVHAANLRNIELKIVPEWRVEVWIDSALLEVSHSVLLVGVQLEESTHWIASRQIQKVVLPLKNRKDRNSSSNNFSSTYHIDPFLESPDEAHPRHLEALLAATAATKEIVARAKDPEATAGALLILARNEYLVEVGVIQRMIIVGCALRCLAVVPAVNHRLVNIIRALALP